MNKQAKHEGSQVSAEPEAAAHGEPVKREILTMNRSGDMSRKNQSPRRPVTREDPDAEQSGKSGVLEETSEDRPDEDWESDGGDVRRAATVARKSRRS